MNISSFLSMREQATKALCEGLRPEAHAVLDEIIECFVGNEKLASNIGSLLPMARRIIDDNDLLVPAKDLVNHMCEFMDSYMDDLIFCFRKSSDPESHMLACASAFFIVTHKEILRPIGTIMKIELQ